MTLKWTPRILFAACAAAGVGAWACLEDQAQHEWARLHPRHREEEGFDSFLPPLPSDRATRGAPEAARVVADRRPSTGCPNLLVRHDDLYLLFRDDVLVARFASLEDYQTYAKEQEQEAAKKEQEERAAAASGDGTRPPPHRAHPKRRACPVLFVEPETDPQGRRRYRRRDAHQKKRDRGTVRGLSAAFWDWQHLGAVPTDRPLVAAMGGGDQGAPPPAAKRLKLAAYNADAMERWLRADLVAAAAEERAAMGAVSDNAMDPHWGGVRWTQQVIDSGKYDGHTLVRPAAT